VHRALACVASDDRDGLDRMVADLQQRAETGRAPAGDVTARLAMGLSAYAQHDWAGAIAMLEPALAETVRIGGSRAQRDLIDFTLLAAHLKAGRPAEAHRLLAARVERRPSTPVAGLA
jgi:hypothetical protein